VLKEKKNFEPLRLFGVSDDWYRQSVAERFGYEAEW